LIWDGSKLTFGQPSISTFNQDVDGSDFTLRNVNIEDYTETVYDNGSTDSPSIDPSNGSVQSVSITSNLNLPAFTNPETGQSVTLLVTGTGTVTDSTAGSYRLAGGSVDLTSYSVVSIFYDGTTYWASVSTDYQGI
jgi:hypothetical protein